MSESPVLEATTPLHRILVDPAWVQGGEVALQAFLPRPKDRERLSVADKGQSAADAFDAWTARFTRSRACGCATVTVGDCTSLGLPVIDDSAPDQHHVAIDFAAAADVRGLAEELAQRAVIWLPATDPARDPSGLDTDVPF